MLYDDRGEYDPKVLKFSDGRYLMDKSALKLQISSKNHNNLFFYSKYNIGCLDIEKQREKFHESIEYQAVDTAICSKKSLVIMLKYIIKIDEAGNIVERGITGFCLETHKLRNNAEKIEFFQSKNFRYEGDKQEKPVSMTICPREEHLLVSTRIVGVRKIKKISIFRIDSKLRLRWLRSINLCISQYSSIERVKFHCYLKTKFIFSGFVGKGKGPILNVVFDFKNRKVVLVKELKTKLHIVRRLTLLGSTIYGVDDYIRKFELSL